MVDQDIVISKISSIRAYVHRVHTKTKGRLHSLNELDTQDIVLLNPQRAVQGSINLATHIVSSEQWEIPRSLKCPFQSLSKHGVISPELSANLQKMVGFRNIAVHDYQAINADILAAIVKHHLSDLEEFCQVVLEKYPN